MESNVKVTFWLNKAKKNSKNQVPVYLRVWYNYDHFTKTTGIVVRAADWDKRSMRVKGASIDTSTANTQLASIKTKVQQVVNQLCMRGKPFDLNTIKTMLEGNETNHVTLTRMCDEHLSGMIKLKGKVYDHTRGIHRQDQICPTPARRLRNRHVDTQGHHLAQ